MKAKPQNSLYKQLLPWALPVLIIIIWQVLGDYGIIATRLLPTPLAVLKAAVQLSQKGTLFEYIGTSTRRAFIGFLIGGSIGFAFGLVNGMLPIFEKLTDTSIQMIRNIPHLSMIPLVILWFGIGEEAKLFLVALGVYFPIYLNTFHGIRSVDPGLIEMGKVYGLRRLRLFNKVILPGALPSILIGFRYSLGIMWITLIVAETISADSGIGYMAMNAREFMQMDVVVLGILLYALLGKLSDYMAKLLERKWLQWHPNFMKS
jgi:sulfonate transport system permease protein